MQIECHDDPDPAIATALMHLLDRHNAEATGREDPGIDLSILLRDASGAVEGGLAGYIWYDWLVVEMLYLPPALRGHDLGTRIMRDVESLAARQGCRGIWLSTLSFQAPLFYERLGFTRFATLEDRPPGHGTVFLCKTGLVECPMGLEVGGKADAADRAVLQSGLTAEVDLVTPGGGGTLAVLVRRDGEMGGVFATSGRGWMFLNFVALPPAWRGEGTGRALVAAAEQAARARGCRGVWLDTFSFQARPFYEKLGYHVFGRLDDYPAGHTRFFLAKRLDGAALDHGMGG